MARAQAGASTTRTRLTGGVRYRRQLHDLLALADAVAALEQQARAGGMWSDACARAYPPALDARRAYLEALLAAWEGRAAAARQRIERACARLGFTDEQRARLRDSVRRERTAHEPLPDTFAAGVRYFERVAAKLERHAVQRAQKEV